MRNLLFLFGEYQFIVAGDSEAIRHAVMQDYYFAHTGKKFAAFINFLRHAEILNSLVFDLDAVKFIFG